MSGVVALVNPSGGMLHDQVVPMLGLLGHRGPDSVGYVGNSKMLIGATRLTITGGASGAPPLGNETYEIFVVGDGEIYNHQELRQMLESKGHRFRTQCDLECVLHLYEEVGPAYVEKLNGVFAICLADFRRQELHAARDPFGVKPLLMLRNGSNVFLCSEIKPLLLAEPVTGDLDVRSLLDLLVLGYVVDGKTMFSDIAMLPAGTAIVCSHHGVMSRNYWSIAHRATDTRRELSRESSLMEHLVKAVRSQTPREVPFGLLLSGGLDSSSLCVIAADLFRQPVRTYSVGCDAQHLNDLPFAVAVSDRLKSDHHEVRTVPTDLVDCLDKVVWALEQPMVDMSVLPLYKVCQIASSDVRVLFSGEGADELLLGYDMYVADSLHSYLPVAVRRYLSRWIGSFRRRLSRGGNKLSLAFRLARMSRGLAFDQPAAHVHWRSLCLQDEALALLQPCWAERVARYSPMAGWDRCWEDHSLPRMSRLNKGDIEVFLQHDLLLRLDRMCMIHSIEGRVPFLDLDLAQYCFSMPVRGRLSFGRRKRPLRKAMRHRLPRSVLRRPKLGLDVPVTQWMRGELAGYVRAVLLDSASGVREYFRMDLVRQLLADHQSGFSDCSRLLWLLVSFSLWYDIFATGKGYRQAMKAPPRFGQSRSVDIPQVGQLILCRSDEP